MDIRASKFSQRFLVAVALWLLFTPYVLGQQRLDLKGAKLCNYYGENPGEQLYQFPADKDAIKFIDGIVRYTGLAQNFTISAANVRNASSTLVDGNRLILYNQDYVRNVISQTGTNWAAVSIFAHEIAHHLNFDTFGSALGPEQELKADKYSGHVLFTMGATREQAKAAMESQPERLGSGPPRTARLAAIENGWIEAQQQQRPVVPTASDESTPAVNHAIDRARQEQEERAEKSRLEKEEQRREERRQKLEDEREERRLKREEESKRANFCCDANGVKWCRLAVRMETGEVCSCYNSFGQWIGSGLACR